MSRLAHLTDMLAAYARFRPEAIGACDLEREMTFRLWRGRACRLANALTGLGLVKGDRVCVLAYNCLEWLEIYVATALAGLVAVPINFRLAAQETRFIVKNCEARAIIVQDDLIGVIEAICGDIGVPPANLIRFGGRSRLPGFADYEALIAAARDAAPDVEPADGDPWTLMYTSGTTGTPKGAIRNHRAAAAMALVTEVELGLARNDAALLVMPMCHANSLFFFGAFSYCGAPCTVYNRRHFDPEHFLQTIAHCGASFTSLVPTHYAMILDLPATVRARYNVDAVAKLMISSAPAQRETKLAIMDCFPNSGLFELYGSTEAGWVTMLHPDEQLSKLGSVGRECIGSRPARLLDANGADAPDGEPGELYSCNAYTFDGYWGLPEKTREAFRGDYCTVGDMARRDEDGFLYLVDRKSNMIITGGENVYPSEVEALIAMHEKVRSVAVIGLPDSTWGERVHAVIVPRVGAVLSEAEVADWCRGRIAGYKLPKSVSFIRDDEMPRTVTGKIQHRLLRQQIQSLGSR
jgi:acyl-CoA synthetase (AMP-forming)/AMP-acid ligase II